MPEDEACRTHGGGDTVFPRELVQTANDVVDHMTYHEFREAFKRETVYACAEALLNSADRAFDFAHVAIGGDDDHGDGVDVVTDAFKFVVGMNVAYGETTRLV
jgi:hypothetical protein